MAGTRDTIDLSKYKNRVKDVLGPEDMKSYLEIMRAWFKGKMTKDEFDEEARKLFTDRPVKVHNEFLLAMIQRCQSVANTLGSRDLSRSLSQSINAPPKPRPVKKRPFVKANFSQRFQPANQLKHVTTTDIMFTDNGLAFACRQRLLPDPAMVQGRLYVTAWENSLEKVEDDTLELITHSVQVLLKNLISHVLSHRRGYQLTRKKFRFNMGTELPKVFHRSHDEQLDADRDLQAISDKAEASAVQSLAKSGHQPPSCPPITAWDFFHAMKSDPGCLSSHTVYCLALERLSNLLYHDGQPELTAERTTLEMEAARKVKISVPQLKRRISTMT